MMLAQLILVKAVLFVSSHGRWDDICQGRGRKEGHGQRRKSEGLGVGRGVGATEAFITVL